MSITRFTQMTRNDDGLPKAVMMTVLKIATKYHKEGKGLYLAKWNDFFLAEFPNATYTFKRQEGPKVPAVNDAINYLIEKGFAERREVSGKDYKLIYLNKNSIERINAALDNDNLTEQEDDTLYADIEAYYKKNEGAKTSEKARATFDDVFGF